MPQLLMFYQVLFLKNLFLSLILKENKSSEVIVNNLTLGISVGNEGLDPTAITIYSAVTNSDYPSLSISSIV